MPVLPFPQPLSAFTIEDKVLSLVGRLADLPSGAAAVNLWHVEFVVSDGEGGPVLLRKTLASGIVLASETTPEWDVSLTRAELGTTIGAGRRWWTFNRTDTGDGLVMGRGPFVVVAEATGA